MMTVRRTVDLILPVVGMVLVLGAVLLLWQNLYLQLSIVIVGIFLIEAGIWKLAHPLLPSARRYHALRAELDDFIQLVRRLNTAAVRSRSSTADEPAVAAVREEMIRSVDRMVSCAGQAVPPDDAASGLSADSVESVQG